MSLHDELLETARYLLRRNQNRPSPADLRRSVSTAYYALFHRLIDDLVGGVVPGAEQQAALARAFAHTEMKKACQLVVRATLPAPATALLGGAVPPELQQVARTFIDLQELRHDADYNRDASLDLPGARNALIRVERAFHAWDSIRVTPVARAFLMMLLLGERWNR